MYGAVDPICMLMLIKNLGSSYEVWDKAATIRFKKPGRSTLHASFKLEHEEIDLIRRELSNVDSIDRFYSIDLADDKGTVCATVEKTIHIRRKAVDATSEVSKTQSSHALPLENHAQVPRGEPPKF